MRQHCAPYIRSEESHRRSAEVYAVSLKSWDISLALNMTYFFMRIISFSHPILLKIHKIKVKTALLPKKF